MIRFVNADGIGHGTQILNAETGEDLTQILSVAYGGKITIGQMVKAELELCLIAADVTAKQTSWMTKHPISGDYVEMAAIEFRDGTRVEFAEDGTPNIKSRELVSSLIGEDINTL